MIRVAHTYSGNTVVPVTPTALRRFGVPPGGPADPELAGLVRLLTDTFAWLELSTPITLESMVPTEVCLAAPTQSEVLKGHPLASLAFVPILPGLPLELGAPRAGARAYVAWPGFMPSSPFPKVCQTGDAYPANPAADSRLRVVGSPKPERISGRLRYIPLQEAHYYHALCTADISRVGTRLKGQAPNISPLSRSEPSTHGAIQVAPGGEFLIHGPDGPTLGGYPKIGAVIQADLTTLAQLRPGEPVELVPVTLAEADAARLENEQMMHKAVSAAQKALALARFQP